MSIVIDLTPTEEARLSDAAIQNGLTPEELARKLVSEHLPSAMRKGSPTLALFAQWAEEDAHMTDQERTENVRIYEEIENNGIPRVRI